MSKNKNFNEKNVKKFVLLGKIGYDIIFSQSNFVVGKEDTIFTIQPRHQKRLILARKGYKNFNRHQKRALIKLIKFYEKFWKSFEKRVKR